MGEAEFPCPFQHQSGEGRHRGNIEIEMDKEEPVIIPFVAACVIAMVRDT